VVGRDLEGAEREVVAVAGEQVLVEDDVRRLRTGPARAAAVDGRKA